MNTVACRAVLLVVIGNERIFKLLQYFIYSLTNLLNDTPSSWVIFR